MNETPQLPPPQTPSLAAFGAASETPAFEAQLCIFEVLGTRCAVPADQIAQVLEVEAVTEVPLAPPHVRGVTFFENQLLPLVAISQSLVGEGRSEIAAVFQLEGVRVGLLIDEVLGFRGLRDSAAAPAASAAVQVQPFVETVKLDGDQPTHILDVARLMGSLRPTEGAH